MKTGRIRTAIGLTAVIFVLLLGSFQILSAAEPKPQYGGTLRVAETGDGISIGYPAKMARPISGKQAGPAIETLFRSDKSGLPVPWLATGIKGDMKTRKVTLTLRKGVKFHDGTDFNAEAAKWNLEQCMAAGTQGSEKFKSIEIVDDYSIRINLTEWDSTLSTSLSQPLGMMISPTAYKKNGEAWCASHPVGTGPFEFVSWEKDVRTVYKKFPGYWQKGKPYLDGIVWNVMLDSNMRQAALRKGEVDLSLNMMVRDAEGLRKDGYVVASTHQTGANGMIPNSANPKSPFSDIRVRRAAQYAIDTEAIVKALYNGEYEATNQWSYKGYWGYNEAVAGYPYNATKARQLLSEAGYPNGFKTKIMYYGSIEWDQAFTAVQGYLKAVGIDAELDPVQSGRFEQTWRGGQWDGLIFDQVFPGPDVTAYLAQFYSGGGKYYAQMLVPEDYAKAIQQAITAADFKTKQKWTKEVMKLMIDKYCLRIPLMTRRNFAVSTKSVHNHGVSATPNMGFWTPEEAWLGGNP